MCTGAFTRSRRRQPGCTRRPGQKWPGSSARPRRKRWCYAKNATEAINLVAYAWGRHNLGPSDVVVTSEIEHHANFVPWLQLRAETGTELRFLRLGGDGMLALDDVGELLEGAKLLAVSAASNVLGTLPPVRALADAAHAAGALVLLDAAQYVPHMPTSVTDLGADFVAFTGHKMLGRRGSGPCGRGVNCWSRCLLS